MNFEEIKNIKKNIDNIKNEINNEINDIEKLFGKIGDAKEIEQIYSQIENIHKNIEHKYIKFQEIRKTLEIKISQEIKNETNKIKQNTEEIKLEMNKKIELKPFYMSSKEIKNIKENIENLKSEINNEINKIEINNGIDEIEKLFAKIEDSKEIEPIYSQIENNHKNIGNKYIEFQKIMKQLEIELNKIKDEPLIDEEYLNNSMLMHILTSNQEKDYPPQIKNDLLINNYIENCYIHDEYDIHEKNFEYKAVGLKKREKYERNI